MVLWKSMRVNAYGFLIALGIFVAYWLTAKRAKRRGLSAEFVWDSLPWVVVFGILGARLYHVLNYWGYYSQNPTLVPQVWLGGLGILGGLGGGLIGLMFYFKIQNSNFSIYDYLDAAAPALPLAQAIGRLGNIFNSENLPYAYWEIGLDLLIFLFIVFLERVGEFREFRGIAAGFRGFSAFKFYIFFYSLGRFILEFFRRDSPWIWGP